MPRKPRGFYLWQRKGIWYTCHALPGRKVWRRSCDTSDFTEAGRAMPGHIQEFYKEQAEQSDPTLGFLLDNYREKHIEPDTVARVNAPICHLLKSFFGGIKVRDFKQSDVERYVAERKRGAVGYTDENGIRRGFRRGGGPTCRRELVLLLAAVNWAGNTEHCKTKDGVRLRIEMKLPKHGEARDVWLKEPQVLALIDAAAALPRLPGERMPREERFLWLSLATMGRKTAITTLRWSTQVDFEARMIRLNPPGRKQTNKRRATVMIAEWLRPKLQQMYDERINDWVFDNDDDIYPAFKALCVKADVPFAHTHTMRHTGVTRALRKGEAPWKVAGAAALSMATMDNVYGHHSPEDGESVVNTLIPRRLK